MYCLSRPPKGLFHKILHWWLVLVTKACNNWPLLLEMLLAKSRQQDVCKICRIDVICSANCQNWYGIGFQRNTHVDILKQSSLFFSSVHQFFDQSHHKNICHQRSLWKCQSSTIASFHFNKNYSQAKIVRMWNNMAPVLRLGIILLWSIFQVSHILYSSITYLSYVLPRTRFSHYRHTLLIFLNSTNYSQA